MRSIAHECVPIILSPELAMPLEQFVGLVRGELFPVLNCPRHRHAANGEKNVKMIGHEHPGVQFVIAVVAKEQSFLNQLRNVRLAQMTFAPATIK